MNPGSVPSWRKLGQIGLAGLLAFLCCAAANQSALNPAGVQAGRIDRLWWLFFWVTTSIYIIVIAVIFVALFRRRSAARHTTPVVAPDPASEKRLAGAVAGAAVVTAIFLFVLLFADVFTGRAIGSLAYASTNILSIRITAHQWWWEVQYQDPVPANMLTTANEIHLPVGQPVRLELRSSDVIHSFWAPNLHGKKDLVPGLPTQMWFQADRLGTFWGQCAEFCGQEHAYMRFAVVAESPATFQQWRAAQLQPATDPVTDSQKKGQQVFLGTTCVMCHTIDGTPARGIMGPSLTHLASRSSIGAGARANNRGNLAGWILNPQHIKPGVRMPQHNLPPADLQALLDYLETLK